MRNHSIFGGAKHDSRSSRLTSGTENRRNLPDTISNMSSLSRITTTTAQTLNSIKPASEKYLGYADLPNQVHRRAIKKGFAFNLMVLGESGTGKSTFINSFFTTNIYDDQHPGPSVRFAHERQVQVHTENLLMKEGGVTLRLAVIDVPGYGDLVDNTNCWTPVAEYIDKQYLEYLSAEMALDRDPEYHDTRVHCLLYFISPTGNGLKSIDIDTMKHLHKKVNIVPIIAKADSLTQEECNEFKKIILRQIEENDINIYYFHNRECEGSSESPIQNTGPFAVVGSNEFVQSANNKSVRGRKYAWGTVIVDDAQHSDTALLRSLLLNSHLDDLIDVTSNLHYEAYRRDTLCEWLSVSEEVLNNDPDLSLFGMIMKKKNLHAEKLGRMTSEMESVFTSKVNEKVQKLEASESELRAKGEASRQQLEREENELSSLKQKLAVERDEILRQYPHLDEQLSRPLHVSESFGAKDGKKKNRFPKF